MLICSYTEKIKSAPSKISLHIRRLESDLKAYKTQPLKHLLRAEKRPTSQSNDLPPELDKPTLSLSVEPYSKRVRVADVAAVSTLHNALEAKGCKLIPLCDIPDAHESTSVACERSQDCSVIDIDEDDATSLFSAQFDTHYTENETSTTSSTTPLTQASRVHIRRLENLLQVFIT